MPAGRPTTYRREYCQRVIELGAEGKSPTEIAVELGVLRETMLGWAGKSAEFSTALRAAKQAEQRWWEDIGRKALFADRFQQQVWAKSMQARFREEYTERLAHTDAQGGPLKVTMMMMTPGAPEPEEGDDGAT